RCRAGRPTARGTPPCQWSSGGPVARPILASAPVPASRLTVAIQALTQAWRGFRRETLYTARDRAGHCSGKSGKACRPSSWPRGKCLKKKHYDGLVKIYSTRVRSRFHGGFMLLLQVPSANLSTSCVDKGFSHCLSVI